MIPRYSPPVVTNPPPRQSNASHRRQRGVTLLESLVTLVIVSLGLLGLAALQASGLKGSYGSYLRFQATQYANDIADRMRANRDRALAGDYDLDMDDDPPECDAGVMATCDMADWFSDLGGLPVGDGSIQVAGNVITIQVRWNDSRAGGASTETITIETQL